MAPIAFASRFRGVQSHEIIWPVAFFAFFLPPLHSPPCNTSACKVRSRCCRQPIRGWAVYLLLLATRSSSSFFLMA